MSCSCGLSLEEAFQTSYLTMKGWKYTPSEGWEKDGFVTTIRDRYDKEVFVPNFRSTGDAYWAQKDSEF